MVMASLEDGVLEGVIVRDIDLAFVGKDTGFMLPVREAGAEVAGNRAIHGLEGLEYEGVIGGTGLDSIRESGVDDANE